MIRPLLLKELREHRWIVIALYVVCMLGLAGLLTQSDDDGSPLVAYQHLVILFGIVTSLALSNRLVVREYSGRTQLFLEALPVSRAQVLIVKWSVGLVLLAIPMSAGFAICVLVARDQVDVTAKLLQYIALRSGTFLVFFYSLAFGIGITLRFRYVVWGVIVVSMIIANVYAQLPMEQWSPFRLVASSMVFEREHLPLVDLCVTWALTIAVLAATMTLALTRDGSFVVALAKRMSPREAIIISITGLAAILVVSQVEQRKPKPVFALKDAITSNTAAAPVAVANVQRVSQRTAQALANQVSTDLDGLQKYLSLTIMPAVAILPDAAMDSDLFLRADLPFSDGVVVRGALNAQQFDQIGFRAFILDQVLDWYSRSRSQQEDRSWLVDGLTQWWTAREVPEQKQLLRLRAAMAGRLLRAESLTPRSEARAIQLSNWLLVREQVGDCLGDALAWRTISLLEAEMGPDRFRSAMTELLGARPPNDFRAWLFEPSVAKTLQKYGATSFNTLDQTLQSALDDDQMHFAEQLATITQFPVSFAAVAMRGTASEVHYRVDSDHQKLPLFAVRYREIGPWTSEVVRAHLARVDDTQSGVLPLSFQRGMRVFTAVEMYDPQLACSLRLGARRWELP